MNDWLFDHHCHYVILISFIYQSDILLIAHQGLATMNPHGVLLTVYVMVCLGLIPKAGSMLHRTGLLQSMSETWLAKVHTNQRNYGIAVADIDFDGQYELFVAGFDGPNLVLKFTVVKEGSSKGKYFVNIAQKGGVFDSLRDPGGQGIGVAACDLDGDGKEEIYVLNTNDAYAGKSKYGDKLFKWRDGKYVDLFDDPVNQNISTKTFAGRSVACLDRFGRGKYGFVVATYAQEGTGSFSLIEMDEYHKENNIETGYIVLQDVAKEAGIKRSTGGRGLVVGPILNDLGKTDIFFNNEGNEWLNNPGDNFLFRNLGNGSFLEVAGEYKMKDPKGAGRGVALADFNHDGLFDIVYGNYEGANRLYLQNLEGSKRSFINVATPAFEKSSMIRTVIAADFDNDGNTEVLFNNINDVKKQQPNRLFKITSYGPRKDPGISEIAIGDAMDEDGFGTGAAIADVDQDGFPDLLISHGEDEAQPVDIFRPIDGWENNWIRVFVETKYGAPARGATVKIITEDGDQQYQVIDSGSGYLCQMEPVAHFGLGTHWPVKLVVQWPDGKIFNMDLEEHDMKGTLHIEHPDKEAYATAATPVLPPVTYEPNTAPPTKSMNVTLNTTKHRHTEL